MKKRSKIILFSSLGVVGISLLSLFLTIFIGTQIGNKEDKYILNDISRWMSFVKDETNIKDIVIPGSHDAGSEDMFYAGETQTYDIYDQLIRGVRYFDLRVNNDDGELVIFHSILNGEDFEDVCEDIEKFMNKYPSEFLILDFQHFKNDALIPTFNVLENYLNTDCFIINDTTKNDIDFVNDLTLGEVRGKCLITVGSQDSDLNKPYQFVRDKDESKRNNSVLASYYYSDYHKSNSNYLINEGFPFYIDKRKKDNNGLFVLQAQLTDPLFIFGPAFKESTHSKNMSNYIKNLKNSEDLQYINIIMRDFITYEKSLEIIKLNEFKRNFK